MTVLAALTAYHRRLEDRGTVPPFGFSTEAIGFALILDRDGRLADRMDLRNQSGKKLIARPMWVPRSVKRPGTTPRPFFLWDNSKFVLGLSMDKKSGAPVSCPAHLAAFRSFHGDLLAGQNDEGLVAVLRFIETWKPDQFKPPLFVDAMLDLNLCFRLDGDVKEDGSPRFVHERPPARRLWERQVDLAARDRETCLVTGITAPVARLHPSIKGVWGAQPSGASLVSFNLDAFASYGKDQGANAPVSEAVAEGYGAALNHLLARDSRNRIQVADTGVVFWAEAADAQARAAEDFLAFLMEPPAPDEAEEQRKIRDTLSLVRTGRAKAAHIAPDIDPATRFYLLGLAPNSARLSVRFWHETSFGPLIDRIGEHWRDLHIEPVPWHTAPSVRGLLYETAVQRKAENIPSLLGGELMRAVLTGGRYPRSLLAAVILRIRAEGGVTGARAALCKACINRALRRERAQNNTATTSSAHKKEDIPVALNRAQTDPAYRMGRLFAVLENIQRAALGRVNASIRERYFGAASATPASVFPLLLRNANHHLSVLRKKSDGGGLAHWFEAEIGDILDAIDMNFPRHLRIEDQGRFAVGYYHQRNHHKSAGTENAEPTPSDPIDPTAKEA